MACQRILVLIFFSLEKAGCGDVPEVDNAVIIAGKKSTYITGDTVRFQCTCDSVKAADANMCVTCSPQGEWDISKVICNMKVVCGDVPKVANTLIIDGAMSKYTAGDTIRYRCTDDFIEAADALMNVTCDLQGNWNTSKVISMKPILKVVCGDVPKVANTLIIDGAMSKYTAGDTIRYRCTDDFIEAADALMNVTCDLQGNWNTSKVICMKPILKVVCGDVPKVANTLIIDGAMSKYTAGDTIRYRCTDDFIEAADALMNVTCDLQGNWNTSKVICMKPILKVVCGDVPKVANTLIIDGAMSKYTAGDTIRYRCTDDFIEAADALMNVTCDLQGNWNTSKVICMKPILKVVCGDVPKVANTLIIDGAMSKYTAGDTIRYRCTDDFIEAADALMNVTCDLQGNWNTSKVICMKPILKVVCEEVPKVANTLVIDGAMSKYTAGDTIRYQCTKDFIEAADAHMNVTCDLQGNWNTSKVICKPIFQDCWYLKTVLDKSEDGVDEVVSPDGVTRNISCDMTTDGGGWTVFQRRGDGSVLFRQNFEAYKELFGNLDGEFWLGNEFLYNLTHEVKQMLRVEICDWNDDARYATYSQFSVGPLSANYRLKVDGYSGNAHSTNQGIQFEPFVAGKNGWDGGILNGNLFSTFDVDNDRLAKKNCATDYGGGGGWWYNTCFSANLNGKYMTESYKNKGFNGISWRLWKDMYSFKGSEMKVRPSSATMATASTNEPFKCPVI